MNRIETAITNLDYILKGGIPEYSANIVSGSPGSGKTIFVQNIIFNNAKKGLKTVYLTTLSESQLKMVRNLGEFAFFDHSYLDDKVIYKDLGFILRKDNIARALSFIADLLKEHSPQLLVIDSFKAIRDMCDDEKEFRTFVFELGAMLSIWEVTTFLIGEYSIEEVNTLCEFAIADGIFHLYGTEDTRFQKRFLSILKCRGTEYLPGEHMFEISSEGIRLYPRLSPMSPMWYMLQVKKERHLG